ncbi:hypothetical protein AVEN_191012-1 [Araneus ventricosus]|uniref:Uncharacterized protein n=1 Tax=Araneus ventricosus TaxID=182803 RepID=A0A4Y2MQ09_ARAVE|nr:hypothetical protein AVEN_191012-1 [Araneus ventricosus]
MSEKRRPFRTPLRRGNKKSAGTRSGEYGACSRTVTLRVERMYLTRVGVCGRALSFSSFHCPLWYNCGRTRRMHCNSHPFQNSLVGFRVDGCTRGYKFMVVQALAVEKAINSVLILDFVIRHFLGGGTTMNTIPRTVALFPDPIGSTTIHPPCNVCFQ